MLLRLCLSAIVESYAARIALQSVSFAVLASLYICTSSDREGRIICGVFLGVLAVVIVTAAPSVASKDEMAPVIVMLVCNLVALLVYCIWKISALVQACLWRLRARGKAPAADPEAPLASMLKPEAASTPPVQVQQTTFHIDDLPRKFSYDEIRAVTGDFGKVVGRGGSAEVFRGLLDDGTAVAVKRITSYKPVGEEEFLREISSSPSSPTRGASCRGRRGAASPWTWPGRSRTSTTSATGRSFTSTSSGQHPPRRRLPRARVGLRQLHVHRAGPDQRRHLREGHARVHGAEIWFSSLSSKSDVYSYGMTLLELVGGCRGYEASRHSDTSETPDLFARVVREKIA